MSAHRRQAASAFGRALRTARLLRELSQEQLARRAFRWLNMEQKDSSVQWLDGVCGPGHSAQFALHRPCALERRRLRSQSRHRPARAPATSTSRMGGTLRRRCTNYHRRVVPASRREIVFARPAMLA
jgi:hypothetical protein